MTCDVPSRTACSTCRSGTAPSSRQPPCSHDAAAACLLGSCCCILFIGSLVASCVTMYRHGLSCMSALIGHGCAHAEVCLSRTRHVCQFSRLHLHYFFISATGIWSMMCMSALYKPAQCTQLVQQHITAVHSAAVTPHTHSQDCP